MRVVVLSEQAVLRAALGALLAGPAGAGEVQEAADLAGAATAARTMPADVILIAHARGRDAISATQILRGQHSPPVLVVAGDHSPAFVRGIFAAGAGGVVTMAAATDELVAALSSVAGGSSYLHPSLGAALAQVETVRAIDELSMREREVLRLIAFGMTNPEIAQALVVSVRTVETHRAHLVRKLGARTRADLVRHALDNGLLVGAG